MKKMLIVASLALGFCMTGLGQQTAKYSARELEATQSIKVGKYMVKDFSQLQDGVFTHSFTTETDTAKIINFARQRLQTVTLTDSVSFTASNLKAGKEVVLRIVNGATAATLAFPAEWIFIVSKPTSLAGNKSALLILRSFGTTNANIIADYRAQP